MSEVDDVRTESYLVRLWRDGRHSGWRASLQQVRTGQTHHFARPEALWVFLQAEMEVNAKKPGSMSDAEKRPTWR